MDWSSAPQVRYIQPTDLRKAEMVNYGGTKNANPPPAYSAVINGRSQPPKRFMQLQNLSDRTSLASYESQSSSSGSRSVNMTPSSTPLSFQSDSSGNYRLIPATIQSGHSNPLYEQYTDIAPSPDLHHHQYPISSPVNMINGVHPTPAHRPPPPYHGPHQTLDGSRSQPPTPIPPTSLQFRSVPATPAGGVVSPQGDLSRQVDALSLNLQSELKLGSQQRARPPTTAAPPPAYHGYHQKTSPQEMPPPLPPRSHPMQQGVPYPYDPQLAQRFHDPYQRYDAQNYLQSYPAGIPQRQQQMMSSQAPVTSPQRSIQSPSTETPSSLAQTRILRHIIGNDTNSSFVPGQSATQNGNPSSQSSSSQPSSNGSHTSSVASSDVDAMTSASGVVTSQRTVLNMSSGTRSVGRMSEELSPSDASCDLGTCGICGDAVTVASEACQASDKIYHAVCFVCLACGRQLRGKMFYDDRGKVYCEEDYKHSGFQQQAEKCHACRHLIVDTVLQALGRSYHPRCFRCSDCSVCLESVPFTVDLEGRPYCVHDYHRFLQEFEIDLTHFRQPDFPSRRFAPRCAKCANPIMPLDNSEETVRVVSMDNDYHVDCYKCEDCNLQLTDEQSQRCYPLGQTLLCYACHVTRLTGAGGPVGGPIPRGQTPSAAQNPSQNSRLQTQYSAPMGNQDISPPGGDYVQLSPEKGPGWGPGSPQQRPIIKRPSANMAAHYNSSNNNPNNNPSLQNLQPKPRSMSVGSPVGHSPSSMPHTTRMSPLVGGVALSAGPPHPYAVVSPPPLSGQPIGNSSTKRTPSFESRPTVEQQQKGRANTGGISQVSAANLAGMISNRKPRMMATVIATAGGSGKRPETTDDSLLQPSQSTSDTSSNKTVTSEGGGSVTSSASNTMTSEDRKKLTGVYTITDL